MEQQLRDIRHQIEGTRDRMGGTIDAIRYKTDIPTRLQTFVNDLVQRAKETVFGRLDPAENAPSEPPETQVDI